MKSTRRGFLSSLGWLALTPKWGTGGPPVSSKIADGTPSPAAAATKWGTGGPPISIYLRIAFVHELSYLPRAIWALLREGGMLPAAGVWPRFLGGSIS